MGFANLIQRHYAVDDGFDEPQIDEIRKTIQHDAVASFDDVGQTHVFL